MDPAWPKDLLVLTDSVVLGAKAWLTKTPGWHVTVEGRESLSVRAAVAQFRARKAKLPSVVVFAVGYNSVWEPGRLHIKTWAKKFDADVEAMLALAAQRGAKKVVWVQLRELPADPDAPPEKTAYGYHFPYVNERLLALRERHPELALADWRTLAKHKGLTSDAIHLTPRGASTMAALIRHVVGIPAH